MFTTRLVATATLAAFLSVTVAPASAQTTAPQPSPLRASIDRAATKSVQAPTDLSKRRTTPVRKSTMQGGGGSGMMVMGIIMTVAGLAATYFVIKEMNKQTDELTNQAQ